MKQTLLAMLSTIIVTVGASVVATLALAVHGEPNPAPATTTGGGAGVCLMMPATGGAANLERRSGFGHVSPSVSCVWS